MSRVERAVPDIVQRERYQRPYAVEVGYTVEDERFFIKDYPSPEIAQDVYERHLLADTVMDFLDVAGPEMWFEPATSTVYIEDLGDTSLYDIGPEDTDEALCDSLCDAISVKLVLGDYDLGGNIHLAEDEPVFKPFDFDLACGHHREEFDPEEIYRKGRTLTRVISSQLERPELEADTEQRVQEFAEELEENQGTVQHLLEDGVSPELADRFWENINYHNRRS